MGVQRDRTCFFDRELDDFEGQNEKTDTSAIVPASDNTNVIRGQNMRNLPQGAVVKVSH